MEEEGWQKNWQCEVVRGCFYTLVLIRWLDTKHARCNVISISKNPTTGIFFSNERVCLFFINREVIGSGHAGMDQIWFFVPMSTTPCVSALVLTISSLLTSDMKVLVYVSMWSKVFTIPKNKNAISVMFCDLSSGCSLSRVSENCWQQHAMGQKGQSVRDCSVKADIPPGAGAVSHENTAKEKIAFHFFPVTLLHKYTKSIQVHWILLYIHFITCRMIHCLESVCLDGSFKFKMLILWFKFL